MSKPLRAARPTPVSLKAIHIEPVTPKLLRTYEGKGIKDICGSGFTGATLNHCAHFVSHVLGFSFGYTCRQHTGQGNFGANLRVHEIFSRCPVVSDWSDIIASAVGLVFITASNRVNLKAKTMVNHPQKHIGIYAAGNIWHYSNSRNKVVKQAPNPLLTAFSNVYSGDIALFYGRFPTGTAALKFPGHQ